MRNDYQLLKATLLALVPDEDPVAPEAADDGHPVRLFESAAHVPRGVGEQHRLLTVLQLRRGPEV